MVKSYGTPRVIFVVPLLRWVSCPTFAVPPLYTSFPSVLLSYLLYPSNSASLPHHYSTVSDTRQCQELRSKRSWLPSPRQYSLLLCSLEREEWGTWFQRKVTTCPTVDGSICSAGRRKRT